MYTYGGRVGDRDMPFLVMEWLDGESLDQVLLARRAASKDMMAADDAVMLRLAAIDALAVAHSNHLPHQDIKPSNLSLSRGRAARR